MNAEPEPVARFRALRMLSGAAAIVIGIGMVLLAAAVGHCSAFGGRCPAEPPPLLEDDAFGTAFFGAFVAVGVPVWLARPGWRRLGRALGVGIPAAFLIGLVVRSAAAG